MNKAKLKSYAPQARKDFIAAVTARANLLGLSDKAGKLEVAASLPQGDVTVIAGQAWPVKVHSQRDQLVTRIRKDGFAQTMEAVAYTWFNRFAALRYMELHDYLGHGHRALSSTAGTLPDILTHAADLAQSSELPGLKAALVTEMKLAGNRDGELYRMLLVAQCNALSAAMPFLFERIDDETELLLPDNLLRTDSVIAKLVDAIDEEDWKEVEIIGWLYQFYISEKKDDVIGKVVKSEDIPAATQLFTPNWIVQYLVQNSVGRLWLMANPASTLKAQWPYYIEPAQQTPKVQAQLDALIQTRMDEDGGSLNPESITLLDPACGSGHILVEAYEVLKAIYLERGYQPRSIPRLILEKNLYGLDIDDRASQMAGFALLMKARADDRRLFNEPIKLNVLSLQESKGLDADVLTRALQTVADESSSLLVENSAASSGYGDDDLFPGTRPQSGTGDHIAANTKDDPARPAIAELITTLAHAKTFGSLIQIPQTLSAELAVMAKRLHFALQNGDLYAKAAAQDLWPLVAQAQVLAMQFDAVVANPPYMGGKGMNPALKDYAKFTFPNSKSDLFAMFIERGFCLCKPTGFNSMVTMQNWMYLSSLESLRRKIIDEKTITSLIHIGFNSFPELNSKIALAVAFIVLNSRVNGYAGAGLNLNKAATSSDKGKLFFAESESNIKSYLQEDFLRLPGSPISYWAPPSVYSAFDNFDSVENFFDCRQGMASSDDGRFVRCHWEIEYSKIGLGFQSRIDAKNSGRVWFPYDKGGECRKWYGNDFFVINWKNDGEDVLGYAASLYGSPTRTIKNMAYYFRSGVTWSAIGIRLSARLTEAGNIFSNGGMKAFAIDRIDILEIIGFLNSNVAEYLVSVMSETLNFDAGLIARLPISLRNSTKVLSAQLVELAKERWKENETALGFSSNSLIKTCGVNLDASWTRFYSKCTDDVRRSQQWEEEINSVFIQAYGLQDELSPQVPESQITLARADRADDCQRLISYAIGCMMGRYSLDINGLIYANAGNVGFDINNYTTFPADADGIVPLTDELWFEDDAANRIREFGFPLKAGRIATSMGYV